MNHNQAPTFKAKKAKTPSATLSRRRARERAVSVLYEAKIKEISPVDIITDEGLAIVDPLTIYLVSGVHEATGDIDAMIARLSSNWEFDRIPIINVCILEIAIFELLDARNTPAVVINEAVDLAKTFSETKSAKFVNGVLSAIASEYLVPSQKPGQQDTQEP